MMLSGMSGAPSGGDGISRKLAEAEKLGKRPGASLRDTTPRPASGSYWRLRFRPLI